MLTSSEVLKDWLGTFWRILISPLPKTFVEEAEKAENKFTSALGWAAFIAIYSYVMPSIITRQVFNFTILALLLLACPLAIVLVPSATHFMLQRVFHRKEYLYDKVLYIYAAIIIVFEIFIDLTFFFPANIASLISYLLRAYQLILLVIAIKAIANIRYWQAIATILCSAIVGVIIFACTLPVVTSLLDGVSRTLR